MKKQTYTNIQRKSIIKLLFVGLVSLTFHSQAQFQGSGIHDRHEHDPRDWSKGDWLEINHDHNTIDRIGIRFRNSGSYYWNVISDKDDGLRFLRNNTNSANASVVFTTNQGLWVKAVLDANQVKGRDWVYGVNRLITDGDIEIGGNKVIRRRTSTANGHLSFTGFTSYRFDQELVAINGDLTVDDGFRVNQDADFRKNVSISGTIKDNLGVTLDFVEDNIHFTAPNNSTLFLNTDGVSISKNLQVNGNFRAGDNVEIFGSDKTFKNQHIQINSDRISADGLSGTKDLLLTDNNGITLRSDKVIIENKDGTATNDVLAIRSARTNLETDLYGENGLITFKDAVFIESANGLTVQQTINAQDLNITPGAAPGAPDYVFEKGYELRSLEEVQKHIEKKGHLPEVPSAGEIEEDGYTMVDMDFTLLKKVEELTLYLLEMKKQNDSLRQENKKLWESMKTLEEDIHKFKNN